MVATVGRQYPQQMVHFLRKSITYADNGKTLDVGYMPPGATIIAAASGVAVTQAFNGDSSNVLQIGPSTDTGTNLWMVDGSLATVAFVPITEAVTMNVSTTVHTLVQCAVTSTASASEGTAEVVICYVPDTDK